MYLLDSDSLINFLNGDKKMVEAVYKIHKKGIATSVICLAEVLEGLYTLSDKRKTGEFEKFISAVEVFPVDETTAREFARIRKALRKKGQLIDNFDLLIAATCLAHDLTLVTGNLTHFKRIGGLKIYTSVGMKL
jgi:predicted nucleic acid-binding protein